MVIKKVNDINDILLVHKEIFGIDFPIESYYKKLKFHEVPIFVYINQNEIIGYSIVVDEKEDKNLYAWYGGVLPEYQGKKVTKKFFDKLVDIAKEKKYLSITVATSNLRPHMLKFAISYGFDIYDVKKRYSGEGNKIYFIYNISSNKEKNMYLVRNGIYIKPVEIELDIVKAYKLNYNILNFYGIENEKTLIYAIKYCNDLLKIPEIVLHRIPGEFVSCELSTIVKNYKGKISFV